MVLTFEKIDSPFCSFSKMTDETPLTSFINAQKRNFVGTS